MVNVGVNWESNEGNWYGGLYAKNLTDEEYQVGGYNFVAEYDENIHSLPQLLCLLDALFYLNDHIKHVQLPKKQWQKPKRSKKGQNLRFALNSILFYHYFSSFMAVSALHSLYEPSYSFTLVYPNFSSFSPIRSLLYPTEQ